MKDVVIISSARTATGAFGKTLAGVETQQLGAVVLKEALKRSGIPAEDYDEIIMGSQYQSGLKSNAARQSALYAGFPKEINAFTPMVNCGTGLKTIALASQSIRAGDNQIVAAGGMENMSRAPYLLPGGRYGHRLGEGKLLDSILEDGLIDFSTGQHMGVTAENLAEMYNISRQRQDEFALRSQELAQAAWEAGKFNADIAPVEIPQRKGDPIIFDHDETYRKGVTIQDLAKLRPAFKEGGTVTAGNASTINDGAAAVVVTTREKADEYGVKPLVRIVGTAMAGYEPHLMGFTPVFAVRKLIKLTNVKLEDIGLIELNEAFAAQAISCIDELKLDMNKVNVNGGAIALGHPTGCTGARLVVTIISEMRRRGERYGMVTLCIGGGLGIATLFELCE